MGASFDDFLDFVLFWVKKRSGVHLKELVVYPAMVRYCLCCHGNGNYAHDTDGLCPRCSREQPCALCGETFVPSMESLGVFCPGCWTRLESTWTTTFRERDPVRAELEVRALVTSARPVLTGCRHTGR